MADPMLSERAFRLGLWDELLARGGPLGVRPAVLRDLGIYGGAQGVWVNKARTGAMTEEGDGVTVSVLHTGSSYADDLDPGGVLYHYPRTSRGVARDLAEVNATQAAARLGLPVFVVVYPSPGSTVRDAHLGWVADWDDDAREFLIVFSRDPPAPPAQGDAAESGFVEIDDAPRSQRIAAVRPGQARFKFEVLRRYGPRCAVCDVEAKELLDAAHIRPKRHRGSDDARNGLVLCALHHRAFDAGLIGIDPVELAIHVSPQGPSAAEMAITKRSLGALRNTPHVDVLRWRWAQWQRG